MRVTRAASVRPVAWVALLLVMVMALARTSPDAGAEERTGRLAAVTNWGYQLQEPRIAHLAGSPHDLLVIDASRDGSDEGAFKAADIAAIKRRPDGGQRIVLAYLSIGEAETYRGYWRWYWGGRWYSRWFGWALAPSWLGPENGEWRGNYAVRYWDPAWQARILGPGGHIERIVAAGFDGVYLDKVDSSIERIAKDRPPARDDMREFVRRIATAGRSARPGFLVVPQNGEELLTDEGYVALIDGIAKEDLLYGEFKDKAANPDAAIAGRTALLQRASKQGRTVLAVEYLDDTGRIAAARERLETLGFVPYFADRPLETLRYGDLPASAETR